MLIQRIWLNCQAPLQRSGTIHFAKKRGWCCKVGRHSLWLALLFSKQRFGSKWMTLTLYTDYKMLNKSYGGLLPPDLITTGLNFSLTCLSRVIWVSTSALSIPGFGNAGNRSGSKHWRSRAFLQVIFQQAKPKILQRESRRPAETSSWELRAAPMPEHPSFKSLMSFHQAFSQPGHQQRPWTWCLAPHAVWTAGAVVQTSVRKQDGENIES